MTATPKKKSTRLWLILITFCLVLSCVGLVIDRIQYVFEQAGALPTRTAIPTKTENSFSLTFTARAAPTSTPTITFTPTITRTPTITPTPLAPDELTQTAIANAQTATEQALAKSLTSTAQASIDAFTATAKAVAKLTANKGDGFYLVNIDIAPGVWRSTGAGDSCYWSITTKTGDIIENHFGMAGGTMYVSPNAFQVEVNRCGTWEYISGP